MRGAEPTGWGLIDADLKRMLGLPRNGREARPRAWLPLVWIVAVSLCLIGAGQPRLSAETLEAGGLSFSDELGGFRLISATGSGRASDPIVLVEELTGMGPAVLTIRQGGKSGVSPPSAGILLRSLVKVVINKGAWRWSGFDMELRPAVGEASVDSDGLSFDQMQVVTQPLHSDLFAEARAEDVPFDRLRFESGRVKPGETVRLAFNLVDLNSRPVFFLAQQPIVLMAEALRR